MGKVPEHASSQLDLTAEQLKTKLLLDGAYFQQVTDFRTSVFQLLRKHRAIKNGEGWATFETNPDPGSLMAADGNVEVLVCSLITSPAPERVRAYAVPTIRIVTNESIVGRRDDGDYSSTTLTQDFVLDEDNDAAYFVDAREPDNESDDEESEQSSLAIAQTQAPLFMVLDGQLLTSRGFQDEFCQVEPLGDASDYANIFPFGMFEGMEDKIHALAVGRDIVRLIANLEPTSVQEF